MGPLGTVLFQLIKKREKSVPVGRFSAKKERP